MKRAWKSVAVLNLRENLQVNPNQPAVPLEPARACASCRAGSQRSVNGGERPKGTRRAVAVRSSRVAAALADRDTAAAGLRLRGKRAAATRGTDTGHAHRHEGHHDRAEEHSELHRFCLVGC